MASPNDTPITFLVPGQRQAARDAARKDSVRPASSRATGDLLRVTATPGEDVVSLQIAGGPTLLLHPENARDLLLAQGAATRSAAAASDAGGDVVVPAQLRWRGLEQAAPTRSGGFLGEVALQAFEVLTGLAEDQAVDFVTSRVVQRLDAQVDAGVYALRREKLAALKGSGLKLEQVPAPLQPATMPLLVLVHGTFVDTSSTFGKLWALHPQQVNALFDFYGNRVYALDHPTVGSSPIANALTLVQALPADARLHLVTHSRGGLVAEVLARVCALVAGTSGAGGAAASSGLGPDDLACFADPAYAAQQRELQDLVTAVRAKGIRVDRVVRVACPARGTLLASHRLDAYLSVLKWTLELAGVPVAPVLVDFLSEVARRRADPAQLPGLAAMMPDTPLVNWLNAGHCTLPGELRVVAGDLQGDSVGTWLKTLLADAYYWTDNDFVVQTRSMYGGTPRAGGASFLLDQGGKVTHFNYFANELTVQAVVAGLTQAAPHGFRVIGPLSWAGQDAGGLRGADSRARAGMAGRAAQDLPAVFMLPGILGSHLKAGDTRIWLSHHLVGGLDRLRYQAGEADDVSPDGPVGMVYGDLIEHLAATHEVLPFDFDWRRPLEEEARRLADAVDRALDQRSASGQPVRILAHGMGGLLARTLQLERPATWARLMRHPQARLLMLGTPNGGSWSPMQVLSGDDTFGNALASFGSPMRNHQARQLMAEMPGFMQVQAGLLDPALRLDLRETWAQLAEDDVKRMQDNDWWHRLADDAQDAAYRWGVPPQSVLDQAVALRRRLDAQRGDLPAASAGKWVLVTGHARYTPDGFELGPDGFVYLDATDGGDGRVPLELALLPGVGTWTLDADHGSLPDDSLAFEAYVDLLQSGQTTRLAPLAATRSASLATPPAHVRSRPSRQRPTGLPALDALSVFRCDETLPLQTASAGSGGGTALRVGVLNGNLTFVAEPLMVGHTRSLSLTGSEQAVNGVLGGAMKASLDAGLYPDQPGTNQIFVNARRDADNPWRAPRPASVVVVGLGEEGTLSESSLTHSTCQGILALAQRAAESGSDAPTMEIAATLMGSGGVGMHPSNAARAIAQGARIANDRLTGAGWPVVSRLTLVELFLERAADAWNGLQVLATSAPGRFDVDPVIASGVGPLRRQIDSGYRGTDYDFISATSTVDDVIAFTLDSRRARTEVRAQSTQGKLLREFVARASADTHTDTRLGRTLFQLLVPTEIEPFLGGTGRVLLELDDRTAPIPWELLDTQRDDGSSVDQRPWAIRTQLLRKLRTTGYRQQVRDASVDDAVLVIGAPRADPAVYPALPGARAEAEAVAQAFGGQGVTALVDDNDATSIINALFERRYRIVHVAGHGRPPLHGADGSLSKGGVVLSDDTFLGADEINSMRTVPELVFVNCCHLGRYDPGLALHAYNRAAFASGVADSLIAIGVRCVIAAGWAVDDEAAKVFAQTFYRGILDHLPFVAAVAAAREAAWLQDKSGATWAAYQCYGDPNWTYRRPDAGATALQPGALAREFEGVASALGLALALEQVTTAVTWMHAVPSEQLMRVRHLEGRFGALWGGMGAVAEAFGMAYAAAGDADAAIDWYRRAVACNDASASMKAHEQLGNLLARRGWQRACLASGDETAAHWAQARAEIRDALHGLQALATLQPTIERLSLVGSAWKRLAMLEQLAGRGAEEQAALAAALEAYRQGEVLARQERSPDLFYPALNRMAVELAAQSRGKAWHGFDDDTTAAVRDSLRLRVASKPDFWSLAGLIELDLYNALARGNLAAEYYGNLQDRFVDLHRRVANARLWRSEADQAAFVLTARMRTQDGVERQAAQALLQQLNAYAGHAPTATPARPEPPIAEPRRFDAVLWHGAPDARRAAQLARKLSQQGLAVWTRAQVPAGADAQAHLELALEHARLGVVLVNARQDPDDEAALQEWTALQAASWRRERPLQLAALAPPRTPVPGFLQRAPRAPLNDGAAGVAKAAAWLEGLWSARRKVQT